jgi:hypothetical protein
MCSSIRAVSVYAAILAAVLSCVLAAPAFAAGDDKPVASAHATAATAAAGVITPAIAPVVKAARPDREKKVYTNDDIERMWPKPEAAASDSEGAQESGMVARRGSAAAPRVVSVSRAPASRENNPAWYAAQVESLYAELERLSSREASLRDFRETGSAAGVTVGLQFGAPCEGITTDNEIQQLAVRRQEIEQQISDLRDAAEQNGMPAAVIDDPSQVLQAGRKPLSAGQERAALLVRQSDLIGQLDGVQSQLADMASQAAAQGIVLLPPTPQWGGNLTTNRIQSLDERAGQLRNAIGENEDAARQAGVATSALP